MTARGPTQTSVKASGTVTKLPVSSSQRLRRHRIYRPLTDPVVQGFISVMSVVLFASSAWALRSNGLYPEGTVAIAAALGSVGAFLLLVGRAMERDKLVEYWQDRRALRLEVRRHRAHIELLEVTIAQATLLRRDGDAVAVAAALGKLTDAAQAYSANRHEDVAVVLWQQDDDRRTVLHASVAPGTRFGALRAGKSCPASEDFKRTLDRLAPHHHAYSVDIEGEAFGVAMLSYEPFDEDDDAIFDMLPACFSLLTAQWRGGFLPSATHIHALR
jgi:hypothetical protein